MKVVTKLILSFFVIGMTYGCSGRQWHNYHGMACGTTCNITYYSVDDLTDSIETLIHLVEGELSVFDQTSQVYALNNGEDIVASDILLKVFNASKAISSFCDGAFDPTVAPLVELWGFGAGDAPKIPTDSEIDSVLTSVGIDGCSITSDRHILKKTSSTMFNFGAIGKGFIAQEVVDMLYRNNATDCMAEVGGDIALSGCNPQGLQWLLQIDAPIEQIKGEPVHNRLMKIRLSDCGIATSGNYRNFRVDTEGHHFGHTISPATGYPVESDVLSATVIAPDATIADGLATACMVLGSEKSLALASKIEGVEILLVTSSNDTTSAKSPWLTLTSRGFPDPIVDN